MEFMKKFRMQSDFKISISVHQRWTKSGVWTLRRQTPLVYCRCGVQKVSLSAEEEVVFS